MVLAIDTSSAWAGVALHGPEGPEGSLSWRAERSHTVQLMPWVDRLLATRNATPRDLAGIAVATGPGSFTGVRVGLSAAKGAAMALGIPLVGVPTLFFTAWPHRHRGSAIRAVITLGRDRLGVAAYSPTDGGLALDWVRNSDTGGAAEAGPMLYCGEIAPALRDRLRGHPAVRILDPVEALRSPAVLAALGWERLMRGEADDPAALQAEYLDGS